MKNSRNKNGDIIIVMIENKKLRIEFLLSTSCNKSEN